MRLFKRVSLFLVIEFFIIIPVLYVLSLGQFSWLSFIVDFCILTVVAIDYSIFRFPKHKPINDKPTWLVGEEDILD